MENWSNGTGFLEVQSFHSSSVGITVICLTQRGWDEFNYYNSPYNPSLGKRGIYLR